MTEDLKTRLEECQVGIASRGQQQPDGNHLAPHLWEQLRQRLQGIYRRATGEADAVLSVEQTAPADNVVGSDRTTIELKMTAFADAAPERDELNGEQTILTYTDRVGVWDLTFFESGEEFPEHWLGDTHWIDITKMWPGVIAQVANFKATPTEQMVGTERDDGVTVGIAMSIAFLLRDRDDPVPALEWWDAAGLTIEQCERVGVDEYDLAPIRAALAAHPVPAASHVVLAVTDNMRSEACRVLNERGKGNVITIPDLYAMLEAALIAHQNDDLPQVPWPASGWAISRIEALETALGDLMTWFPDQPSPPEWRIRAGERGADDAVAAARAALATATSEGSK